MFVVFVTAAARASPRATSEDATTATRLSMLGRVSRRGESAFAACATPRRIRPSRGVGVASEPERAVRLEPRVELPERACPERIDPRLRARLHLHESRVPEDAEMLRDLGLVQLERPPDAVDRLRAVTKELDDSQAVGLGERDQGMEHE